MTYKIAQIARFAGKRVRIGEDDGDLGRRRKIENPAAATVAARGARGQVQGQPAALGAS